ncbi:unnamed protein product, partial [Ilex paraguariensis]
MVDDNVSPSRTSLDRKVSRSKSVGYGGSRSFSGDFFERISTGFGDCALCRVESQRKDKSRAKTGFPTIHRFWSNQSIFTIFQWFDSLGGLTKESDHFRSRFK